MMQQGQESIEEKEAKEQKEKGKQEEVNIA